MVASKVPSSTEHDAKILVYKMLSEVGLVVSADKEMKKITIDERKRVFLGVEILVNPSFLFLDEPTSGLDAFSTTNYIKILKRHVENNAVAFCTIKQPSPEVFALFDVVVFLKSGKTVYVHRAYIADLGK